MPYGFSAPSPLPSLSRQSLFRQEALEFKGNQWMGSIRIDQQVSNWLVVAISTIIAGALVTFMTLGSVTRKVHVTGILVPINGTAIVTAQNSGTLLTNFITEGEQVKAGQALFAISTERYNSSGEVTKLLAQQLAIRAETLKTERHTRMIQNGEKRRSIDAQIANLINEYSQLEQELEFAKYRQNLAQMSLRKFQTLESNGFVSSTQVQQKQEELIDLSSRLSSIERNKLQLQANRLSLIAEKKALESDLAATIDQLDRSEASLRQEIVENQSRASTIIKASLAGLVTTITNQPGQAVAEGQVLATLIPLPTKFNSEGKASLEAILYAPSRSVGFVATGQTVRIRYQAFPYQKFGLYEGTITNISTTPLAPNELPTNIASTILSNAQQIVPGFNASEAMYRIKVSLRRQSIDAYGKEHPLKPGMTLEADILQDKRKIWEWIIEPLLAVAHR